MTSERLMQRAVMHEVMGRGRPGLPCGLVLTALFMALATSVAAADEAVWPKNSASEISTFATILRYQIHADHCSGEIPQLEARFDGLMMNLRSRIQDIATDLLASDEFRGMKDMLVPVEITDSLKHSFHDAAHNVERIDAESTCLSTLQSFSEIDDEALKSALRANFTAVQNMSKKLVEARAR